MGGVVWNGVGTIDEGFVLLGLPQLGYIVGKRVVRVRSRQQRLDRKQHRADLRGVAGGAVARAQGRRGFGGCGVWGWGGGGGTSVRAGFDGCESARAR